LASGGSFSVLTFSDFVDLSPQDGDVDVHLRDAEYQITRAIRGLGKDDPTVLGLFTRTPEPPPNPNLPARFAPPPPPADYQQVEGILGDAFDVQRLELDELANAQVDLLIVGKTGPLSPQQVKAMDDYLMGGGSVIALSGRYGVVQGQGELSVEEGDLALIGLLDGWGVQVRPGMVMDPVNASFPVPVVVRRAGYTMKRVELMAYPFFPAVRADSLSITLPWASPLTIRPAPGVKTSIVASSSQDAWVRTGSDVSPDFVTYPEAGFEAARDEERLGPQPMVAVLRGTLPSHLQGGKAANKGACVAVIGSKEMAGDIIGRMASLTSGDAHAGNIELLRHLAELCLEDAELLLLRDQRRAE
jgi:hypothetical protein